MKIIISLIEIIELNIDPYVDLIFEEGHGINISKKDLRFSKISPHQKINSSLVYAMFKIMHLCYSILGFSCQQNPKFQEHLYKHLRHLAQSNFHKKFNVNQIDFFTKLMESNEDLKNKTTVDIVKFFVDLIILHGKYTEFIEIFKIYTTKNIGSEYLDLTLENNKKILSVLFDDYNIELIHVYCLYYFFIKNLFKPFHHERNIKQNHRKFFAHSENLKEYQGNFIKIVGSLLKPEVGMSFISKCSKNLDVCDLLKFLLAKTIETKSDSFETNESSNLQIKNSLVDILLLFFTKSSQSLQDFYKGTPVKFLNLQL